MTLIHGDQKINLHEPGRDPEPRAGRPPSGSTDLCFISDTDTKKILQELSGKVIQIIADPVKRSGAGGKILSIY
jgi:hypothetical protein